MKYIILDIDNCISDDAWRVKYINWQVNNVFDRYANYHALSCFDDFVLPSENGNYKHIAGTFLEEHAIIISTSRFERYEVITRHWLARKDIKPIAILMRPDDYFYPTVDLKRDHYEHIIKTIGTLPAELHKVYDDNPEVCALYRELGVPVRQLAISNPNQYERWKDENSARDSG